MRIGGLVAVAGALATVGLMAGPAIAAPAPVKAGVIRIVDGAGAPIVGAGVQLTSVATPFTSTGVGLTDANGRLDLTTIPGYAPSGDPFTVFIYANGYRGFWDRGDPPTTQPVDIQAGAGAITATVANTNSPPDATTAGVSGTVTDALTGDPLFGIQVTVVGDGRGGEGGGGGQTLPDGTYYLRYQGGLPNTGQMTFTSLTTSAAAPFGYSVGNIPTIPLTAGRTTTGVSAPLTPRGQVSGVVTEVVNGRLQPLAGAQVNLLDPQTGVTIEGGFTTADGSYVVPVQARDYIVQVQKIVGGNVTATACYDGAATRDAATTITVAPKAALTGIDVRFGTLPPTPPSPTPVPVLPATG